MQKGVPQFTSFKCKCGTPAFVKGDRLYNFYSSINAVKKRLRDISDRILSLDFFKDNCDIVGFLYTLEGIFGN